MVSVLIGIARLASEGQLLEAKRAVEYRTLPSRGILNRCTSGKVPFSWTINPYRAASSPVSTATRATRTSSWSCARRRISRRDFRQTIYTGRIPARPGAREARRGHRHRHSHRPHQPAERRYGLTRRILRALADTSGHRIFSHHEIGPGGARDVELLQEVHARHWLCTSG